jgi:hypothetical protein
MYRGDGGELRWVSSGWKSGRESNFFLCTYSMAKLGTKTSRSKSMVTLVGWCVNWYIPYGLNECYCLGV